MAAVAAMRTAYGRLGFTAEAAAAITDHQDIDSCEELGFLTDVEVESLCKAVRRPGGTIVNPDAGIAGQPANIPNPDIQVSLRAENNLKLAAWLVRHKIRTSRDIAPADITLQAVRAIKELRQAEENWEAPTDSPVINYKDWPKTMEGIVEYLHTCPGTTKIPLAYVVRENQEVPEGDDPTEDYASSQDEMIARAPHLVDGNQTETFKADNVLVWEKISSFTREEECWTYVKPAQRSRNGRLAFQNLYNHYLGPNNINNMATEAETCLQSATFNGKKKRWNFEKYVRTHAD